MNQELLQQFPQIEEFLECVKPVLPAYRHGLLSYVAIVHAGESVILGAVLKLSVDVPTLLESINQTLSLRVGQRHLEIGPSSIESSIQAIISGHRLPICADPLLQLLPDSAGRYSAYHELCAPPQIRKITNCLQIAGLGRFEFTNQRQRVIDRELHEIGFDSFEQLMRTMELESSDRTSFSITVDSVARLKSASLHGLEIKIEVQLAKALDRDRLRVTVRNADPSSVRLPDSFSGSDFDWIEKDSYWIGSLGHVLKSRAVLICRAVYAGQVQNEIRLYDPHALPNPRRMMFDVIDPGLERLRKLLLCPTDKQRDDFQTAVGLLFQMLGFAPAPIGKLSGMTNEPDIFVAGGNNEMLVVECTTDVPDDDKLMKLVSRVARAREALTGSYDSVITVLPMLLVSVHPDELRPIREKADAHGVIILCRPEIEAAVIRSEFVPDASETLRQWRNRPLVELLTIGLN